MGRERGTRSVSLRALGVAGVAVSTLALGPSPARAQNGLALSPDVTIEVGSVNPTLTPDEDVIADDGAGGMITPRMTGVLPTPVDLSAYHFEAASGDELFSVDHTTVLGAVTAEPRDVVRLLGGVFSLAFDGSVSSIPARARVDAVGGVLGSPDLLLSFDVGVTLPAVGFVADEDVVLLSAGVYSLFFDGSANGVAARLDLDAVDQLNPSGDLVVSFDVSGSVGGVAFDDEDALRFAPGPGTWSMYFDASAADPDYGASDTVAIPEPDFGLLLASGLALLAWLARTRGSRGIPWDVR